MSIRVKSFNQVTGTGGQARVAQTEYRDSSFGNRETTVNGYTFHWGPNQVRNFLDDGVGLAHAGFQAANGTEDAIIQDTQPFSSSRA